VFQLQKATNNAVNSLISVMNDPEAPASARVRAATAVLEQALRALETEGLEERIAVLEQAYGSRGPNVNKLSARGRWDGPHYE
jgi:ribosomal protein S7